MRIAIVVFDGAEELDFVGPWEVLTSWAREVASDAEVLLVAESPDPVRAGKGMRVLPDTTWDAVGASMCCCYPAGVALAPWSRTRHCTSGCASSRPAERS
jgi:putative intracellular protease/amidase